MQLPLVTAAELHVGSGQTYTTIQAAITAASAGDTIIVHPGTYSEVVDVNKESLTLRGMSGAIIRPIGGPHDHAVGVTKDYVTIEGFEIDGTGGTVYFGIAVSNSRSVNIRNNVVHDIKNKQPPENGRYGVGILFWGVGVKMDNNIIEGNTVYNTGRMGIFIGTVTSSQWPYLLSSNNIVRNNVVYDTWQDPQGDGGASIQINGAKNSLIKDNEIYNTRNNWWGIYIGGSSTSNRIIGNNIHDNYRGIVVWSNPTWVQYEVNTPGAPEIHFNNIYGNTQYGLRVVDTDPTYSVDAKDNWWGGASGPTHPSNPGGTGDAVTDNVDFTPWLGASLSNVDSEKVQAGTTTTVGSSTMGVSADVTTTTGTPTVTVATYTSNPGGKPTFSALGKYVDVQIDNAAGVTQILIKVYYTDAEVAASGITESTLKLYWWTGSAWVACSDTGVDTVNNYIWARITATSIPNLNQLTGTPFGAGGVKPAPVGGYVIPVSKASVLAPYLALFGLAGAIAVVAVKLRRRKA
ncbi:MAG: right-handed parallel beta-helix repeat-containing protein [Candidatus Bathyarchaeia archaeon]